MADKVCLVLPPSRPSPRGRLSRFAPNPHFGFFFIFCKARRRRAGMCDRREQIPQKRGMAGKVGLFFLPPSKPSPMGRLSRFAPRGQWSSVSAEFSSPSRSPSVLFPQRQHFPRFSAVVELLFRRILAMGFLDGIVSPCTFRNGSRFRISLPLWNGFSAAFLLWASWTALSLRAPSTTAEKCGICCRCGKDRRAHLPKVIRILPDLARRKRKRGYRRYRGPRAIAHLRKVSKKRGKTAHLRKVERGGWKRKRGYKRYRGSRAAPSEGEQKCGKARLLSKE